MTAQDDELVALTDAQLATVNNIVDNVRCEPPNDYLRVQYIGECCFAAGLAAQAQEIAELRARLELMEDKRSNAVLGWSNCSKCCAGLQARAEKAEAERDALERTIDAREKESWGRLQRALNAEAERDALLPDAERYRDLRDWAQSNQMDEYFKAGMSLEAIDAAIDARIAARAAKEGA